MACRSWSVKDASMPSASTMGHSRPYRSRAVRAFSSSDSDAISARSCAGVSRGADAENDFIILLKLRVAGGRGQEGGVDGDQLHSSVLDVDAMCPTAVVRDEKTKIETVRLTRHDVRRWTFEQQQQLHLPGTVTAPLNRRTRQKAEELTNVGCQCIHLSTTFAP